MITLHRLNKQEFVLNADLVETIEATPDTLVTLTNGKKIMVRDGITEVVGKIIDYRRMCNGTIQVVHAEKRETARASEAAEPDGENDGNERRKTALHGGEQQKPGVRYDT